MDREEEQTEQEKRKYETRCPRTKRNEEQFHNQNSLEHEHVGAERTASSLCHKN